MSLQLEQKLGRQGASRRGGGTGNGTCTTGAGGTCTVTRRSIRKKKGSVVYTVSNITLATYAYTPADNHGSTGVTVTKP